MIERASLPNRHALSRRRLITVGAGAAVGVLAGLSPRRAGAVLKLDVTQGTIQPVPIAIPDFVGVGLQDPNGGRHVSQNIPSKPQRSRVFAPIDPPAPLQKNSTIDNFPRFSDLRARQPPAAVSRRAEPGPRPPHG